MQSVKKMYVIPPEFMDSMLRKSKITQDPILNLQENVVKEKEKLLDTPLKDEASTETAAILYSDKAHKEATLDEIRKKEEEKPTLVKFAKPIVKVKEDEVEEDGGQIYKRKGLKRITGVKQERKSSSTVSKIPSIFDPTFIKHMYDYDPDVVSEDELEDALVKLEQEVSTEMKGTKEKSNLMRELKKLGVKEVPASTFKSTRSSKKY